MNERLEEIRRKKEEWREKHGVPDTIKFYTPADIKDFDFLEKVGFPGEYPFAACSYPYPMTSNVLMMKEALTGVPSAQQLLTATGRAGMYSGYGSPEDTRDFYTEFRAKGMYGGGPNVAFDLPTQCGYDSDNPMARGEVGRVGVSIDTLRDFEVLYEAFIDDMEIDKTSSNFTINAPCNIIFGMYLALADERGIPWDQLRATPQNDILKEFIARGTYIFSPKLSMRMFRDSLVFFTEHCPRVNITSIGGYHIREAGATREQDLGWSMAIGAAYLQEGIDAGLEIDQFARRFTFNRFGGSMEFFKEIAFQRASRRMWAKLLKERFHSKNPRSMTIRQVSGAGIGPSDLTKQRPLNNLTRTIVGAFACALSGGPPAVFPAYDEPLGLGWSAEAQQLQWDAMLILLLEAGLNDVVDPFAGSYYMEYLTDEIEEASWEEYNKVEDMGGAVEAIENGYIQRELARSAHETQNKIERGEKLIVGVNCFASEKELEVIPPRSVPYPYDPVKRERAEEKQLANLKEVKRKRDNQKVTLLLEELEKAAKNEEENLFPYFIRCAKAYVTEQEQCDVLRRVFGEYKAVAL